MEIFDWPSEFVDDIVASSFYPVDRVAESTSIFSPDVELQDFGRVWRASVTVEPPQEFKARYTFEAFLRRLKGGVNQVRLYDFDYAAFGPIGTGRSASEAQPVQGAQVTYTSGARYSSGAGWTFDGRLKCTEAIQPGQAQIRLGGLAVTEETFCVGDTLEIAGRVALVDQIAALDGAGCATVLIEPSHNITASAGAAVTIGAPYQIAMRLVNGREATANGSDVNLRTRFQLDFIGDGSAAG